MKRSVVPFGNDVVRLRLVEEKDLEITLLRSLKIQDHLLTCRSTI